MKKLLLIVFTILFTATFAQKPTIEWANISGGTFLMGSPENEAGRNIGENQHQVTVSAFMMSKYEITVWQFKAFIDATGYKTDAEKDGGSTIWNGSNWKKKKGVNWKCNTKGKEYMPSEFYHPVIHVSWNDAKAFADWMGSRLPTEAEWEYACRAGNELPFNTGSNLTTEQANYSGNKPYTNHEKGVYRDGTLPVGSFSPNTWGLYDMHGNVSEYCNDFFGDYSTDNQIDPQGTTSGLYKVLRGGCYFNSANECRSASRTPCNQNFPSLSMGFRIAKSE